MKIYFLSDKTLAIREYKSDLMIENQNGRKRQLSGFNFAEKLKMRNLIVGIYKKSFLRLILLGLCLQPHLTLANSIISCSDAAREIYFNHQLHEAENVISYLGYIARRSNANDQQKVHSVFNSGNTSFSGERTWRQKDLRVPLQLDDAAKIYKDSQVDLHFKLMSVKNRDTGDLEWMIDIEGRIPSQSNRLMLPKWLYQEMDPSVDTRKGIDNVVFNLYGIALAEYLTRSLNALMEELVELKSNSQVETDQTFSHLLERDWRSIEEFDSRKAPIGYTEIGPNGRRWYIDSVSGPFWITQLRAAKMEIPENLNYKSPKELPYHMRLRLSTQIFPSTNNPLQPNKPQEPTDQVSLNWLTPHLFMYLHADRLYIR